MWASFRGNPEDMRMDERHGARFELGELERRKVCPGNKLSSFARKVASAELCLKVLFWHSLAGRHRNGLPSQRWLMQVKGVTFMKSGVWGFLTPHAKKLHRLRQQEQSIQKLADASYGQSQQESGQRKQVRRARGGMVWRDAEIDSV